MALLAAPGILLSSTPEAVFDDRQAHRSMAGALASPGLAAVALVVLTRLPAEGTALFESASIAAWALSRARRGVLAAPDQILPRKACESLVAGAAAGALYLAHADATLLATIRLVCLAGAPEQRGARARRRRAARGGRRGAAAARDGVPRGEPGLAGRGGAAAAPRRVALRGPRGRAARTAPSSSRPRGARRRSSATPSPRAAAGCGDAGTSTSRHRADVASIGPHGAREILPRRCPSSPRRRPTRRGASARSTRRASATPSRARTVGPAPVPTPPPLASYAAAAAHASSLRRHRAAAGWGVVVRRARAALPAGAPERGEAAALAYFVRVLRAAPRDGLRQFRAGRGLGPRSYIVARAHGARPRRRPRALGPGARGAGRRRRGRDARAHVVSAALVSWPLTLAPFFLRGATGDGLLLGALGCAGSAGVALFYEEPRRWVMTEVCVFLHQYHCFLFEGTAPNDPGVGVLFDGGHHVERQARRRGQRAPVRGRRRRRVGCKIVACSRGRRRQIAPDVFADDAQADEGVAPLLDRVAAAYRLVPGVLRLLREHDGASP